MVWTIEERSLFPGGGDISLFSIATRPALGSNQTPIQWVPEALSPGEKRPDREGGHSMPWPIPLLPRVSSWCDAAGTALPCLLNETNSYVSMAARTNLISYKNIARLVYKTYI